MYDYVKLSAADFAEKVRRMKKRAKISISLAWYHSMYGNRA